MINLDLMHKRLDFEGGTQEERMIKDKYKTFQKALLYSYQSVTIRKENEDICRKALINPDKNHKDYDDKILSIDYKYCFKPGDIFEWINTNSYWIVFLPELTEDAYFRSEIRRCRYRLSWLEEDETVDSKPGNRKKIKHTSYAYIRGPVETKINFTSKAELIVDNPNLSLEIYLPNNQETKKHFKRYQRFAFNDRVWEVQAVDAISTDGILQIIALENYENKVLDDFEEQIKKGVPKDEIVTDAFYLEPLVNFNQSEDDIILGETFIKPLGWFKYKLNDKIPTDGLWSIEEKKYPVKLEKINNGIQVYWNLGVSGQFTLCYQVGDKKYRKIIIVESLF